MTEYWVSQAKYYCKFCKCYLADNKPSRQLHDSSARHKTNVQMFMQNQKQEKLHGAQSEAQLQRQLAEIEQAALLSMANDPMEGSQLPPPPPPPPLLPPSLEQPPPAWQRTRGTTTGSFPSKEEGQGLEDENSGIYSVRGQVYLDGKVFEHKLHSGMRCQVFLESLDEWLDGEILRRRATHVLHTSVELVTFDVRYRLPEGADEVEEAGVRGDRLRILANTVDPADDPRLLAINSPPQPPEAPPQFCDSTGLGMWTTVSVREVDEAAEQQAFEAARKDLVEAMNHPESEAVMGLSAPATTSAPQERNPYRDISAKTYQGFSLEAVSQSAGRILEDGAVVAFRKRKAAGPVASDTIASRSQDENAEMAEAKEADEGATPSATASAKAISRPRNIRKRTTE